MIRYTLVAAAALALTVAATGTLGARQRPAASPQVGATLQGQVSHFSGNTGLVVYVATAPGSFAPPAEHPVMDQKDMRFSPHVLTVLLGTTVDFANSDGVDHNVFSPTAEGYNLGTWSTGTTRSYTFNHLGPYTQLCSIHPHMEAFILVVQNPYYATTNESGYFEIQRVPPGHYDLKVWGEHLSSGDLQRTFPVDLTAKGTTATIRF